MSATNHTDNLGLSQFGNTDVPAWRQDYNGDMLKIDNAYMADIKSATAETEADASDYLKFYDVSGDKNKKILISDLLKGAKVEDLTDTDITTPTDDDGLVYDSTAQKWKNKQITTKEQWKKNGAYNLYQMNMSSQVISGVTFTKISKGTFSLNTNGTLTDAVTIDINPAQLFPADTYKFLGAPSGVTNLGLAYIYQKGGTWYTAADGDIFTTDGTETTGWVRVYLYAGCNLDGTEIFKPMITTDLNATYDDFVEFAKTNRELTEVERGFCTLETNPSVIRSNYSRVTKCGNTVVVSVYIDLISDQSSIEIMRLSNYLPVTLEFSAICCQTSNDCCLGEVANTGSVKLYSAKSGWNYGSIAYIID